MRRFSRRHRASSAASAVRRFKRICGLSLLIMLAVYALMSCDPYQDRYFCDYNVQLAYRYAGTDRDVPPDLDFHLEGIEQYIYNDKGLLIRKDSLSNVNQDFFNNLTLMPGTYTMVAWSNRKEKHTRRRGVDLNYSYLDDGLMTNIHLSDTWQGYYEDADPLYYASHTFTVSGQDTVYIIGDMSEKYAKLTVHVRGLNLTRGGPSYYMQLTNVPSETTFEGYALVDYPITHRTPATVNLDGNVNAAFVTFRFRNNSHPMLSLWNSEGAMLMREINLQTWFIAQGYDLDEIITQKFEIDINISDNQIVVSPTVDGWELGW